MFGKHDGSYNSSNVNLTIGPEGINPFHEPKQIRRGGGPRPKTAAEKVAHFWRRVDRSGGDGACWPWTGTRLPHGYGMVAIRTQWPDYTYRVAYQLICGPIPQGLVVRHSCDNPPCCNPSHLQLGTQGDNIRDSVARGRQATERPGAWRIEPELRRRLIAEALAGPYGTVKRLAREHNVVFTQLAAAVRRERQRRSVGRHV